MIKKNISLFLVSLYIGLSTCLNTEEGLKSSNWWFSTPSTTLPAMSPQPSPWDWWSNPTMGSSSKVIKSGSSSSKSMSSSGSLSGSVGHTSTSAPTRFFLK